MLDAISAIGTLEQQTQPLYGTKDELDQKREECLKQLSSAQSEDEIFKHINALMDIDTDLQNLVLKYKGYLDTCEQALKAYFENPEYSKIVTTFKALKEYFENHFKKPIEAACREDNETLNAVQLVDPDDASSKPSMR